MIKIISIDFYNQDNFPNACIGVSDLPLLWRGQNFFVTVLGEEKLKYWN